MRLFIISSMNTLLAMLKFNLKIENIYFKTDKKNLKNFKTKNLIRYAIRIKLIIFLFDNETKEIL